MIVPGIHANLKAHMAIDDIEAIDAKINRFTRKLFVIPPGLSCCSILSLNIGTSFMSIQYKSSLKLRDSQDEVLRVNAIFSKTEKLMTRWTKQNKTSNSKRPLDIHKMVTRVYDVTQRLINWWLKEYGMEKRGIVIQDVRQEEDQKRIKKAVQESQQGQWTTWENALQRTLTWKNLWTWPLFRSVSPSCLCMTSLHRKHNLIKWDKKGRPTRHLCSETRIIEHVTSGSDKRNILVETQLNPRWIGIQMLYWLQLLKNDKQWLGTNWQCSTQNVWELETFLAPENLKRDFPSKSRMRDGWHERYHC